MFYTMTTHTTTPNKLTLPQDINECATSMDNCTTPETTCRDLIGSFECICNSPEYRGTSPACDYFCPSNSTCIVNRNGRFDWPQPYDGITLYAPFTEISWRFVGTSKGFRLTLHQFLTDDRDDFLSFFVGDTETEIIALSGNGALGGRLYNREALITGNGSIEEDGSTVSANISLNRPVTVIFNSSSLTAHFSSDVLNQQTGFVAGIEYDVDDCPTENPCSNSGTCRDGLFTYQCEGCTGYDGMNCDMDINECLNPTSCHPNATCTNTNGSFSCACNTFYTGDGMTCNQLVEFTISATPTTSSFSINVDITNIWISLILTLNITIIGPDGTISRDVSVSSLVNTCIISSIFFEYY